MADPMAGSTNLIGNVPGLPFAPQLAMFVGLLETSGASRSRSAVIVLAIAPMASLVAARRGTRRAAQAVPATGSDIVLQPRTPGRSSIRACHAWRRSSSGGMSRPTIPAKTNAATSVMSAMENVSPAT